MEKIVFTEKEIDIIMEGIDSWASDFASSMMGSMIGCFAPKEIRESDKFKQEEAKKEAIEKEKRQLRKEQAIMLKAKLLSLKQKVAVSDFLNVS